MDIKNLSYFLTVAEELNFTKAADKLNMSQPPLSRQIKDLEEELGIQLFERTSGSKQVKLTEPGQLMQSMAREIIRLTDKAKTQMLEFNNNSRGTIFLGCIGSTTYKLLPYILSSFRKQYPGTLFDIVCSNADELIKKLEDGLIDMAIMLEPTGIENFDHITLSIEYQSALIPKSFPLANEKSSTVTVKQLADYPLAMPSRISTLNFFKEMFLAENLEPNILCLYNTSLAIVPLVAQGEAIALVPRSSMFGMDTSKMVLKRLTPHIVTTQTLLRKKDVTHSQISDLFFEYMKNINIPKNDEVI